MIKNVKRVLTAFAAICLLGAFASCSSDDDDDSSSSSSFKLEDVNGIELLDVTGSVSWEGNGIAVPVSVAKRLTAGSVVYFDIDKYAAPGADAYLKFEVNNGSWGSCGVSKYYKAATNKEVDADENGNNPGVYDAEVAPGVYYFKVTDANLETLKKGFSFQGNLTVNKVGITGLTEKADTSGAAIVKGEKLTFTAAAESVSDSDVVVLFKVDRTAKGKKEQFTLSELDLEVTLNGEDVTVPAEMTCVLDEYGGFDGAETDKDGKYAEADRKEYKYKLQLGKKIEIGDVVTVELKSAKITDAQSDVTEAIVTSLTAAFVDVNAAAAYWNPLVATENENFLPVITDVEGEIKTEAPSEEDDTSDGTEEDEVVVISEETGLGWNTNVAFNVSGFAAGDKIVFTLKEDSATNECQFINSSWEFGGNKVTITCTTDSTNGMYYASAGEGETAKADERPSVHPVATGDADFEMVLTQDVIDMGTIYAVGTATMLSAKIVKAE